MSGTPRRSRPSRAAVLSVASADGFQDSSPVIPHDASRGFPGVKIPKSETIAMIEVPMSPRTRAARCRRRIAVGLALAMTGPLTGPGDAIAQSFPALAPLGGRSTLFQELDRDKDGTVSHAEFMQHRDDQFARLDKNGDGFIDRDEYMTARGPKSVSTSPQVKAMREARFRRINTSGSGKISRTEWNAESERLFAAADANKDGRLTPDELRGPMHQMEP